MTAIAVCAVCHEEFIKTDGRAVRCPGCLALAPRVWQARIRHVGNRDGWLCRTCGQPVDGTLTKKDGPMAPGVRRFPDGDHIEHAMCRGHQTGASQNGAWQYRGKRRKGQQATPKRLWMPREGHFRNARPLMWNNGVLCYAKSAHTKPEPVCAPDDELHSATELAAIFDVAPNTIRTWALKGELPVFLTPGGQRLLYRQSDLTAFFHARIGTPAGKHGRPCPPGCTCGRHAPSAARNAPCPPGCGCKRHTDKSGQLAQARAAKNGTVPSFSWASAYEPAEQTPPDPDALSWKQALSIVHDMFPAQPAQQQPLDPKLAALLRRKAHQEKHRQRQEHADQQEQPDKQMSWGEVYGQRKRGEGEPPPPLFTPYQPG